MERQRQPAGKRTGGQWKSRERSYPEVEVAGSCPYCEGGNGSACTSCFYEGTLLRRNFDDLISSLNRSTGLDWGVEHVGGGFFAISSDVPGPNNGSRILITNWTGGMSGSDSYSDVYRSGGWLVGAYPIPDRPEVSKLWGDDGILTSEEELFDAVAEAKSVCEEEVDSKSIAI